MRPGGSSLPEKLATPLSRCVLCLKTGKKGIFTVIHTILCVYINMHIGLKAMHENVKADISSSS